MPMSLEEMLRSHREPGAPKPVRQRAARVVSPLTNEHLGFCNNCGVVSYCLVEEQCPVCSKRAGNGVAYINKAIDSLQDVVNWLESLGPENSWSVEEYREPLHIKQTALSLLRVLTGLRDRETNYGGE